VSGVPRAELFITTKVMPGAPMWGQPPKTFDEVVAQCRAAVANLGVDQVSHEPILK